MSKRKKTNSNRVVLRCAGGAYLAVLLCLQLSGAASWSVSGAVQAQSAPSWEDYSLIAHAMGAVDGYSCTPSLEAFTANYQRGYRLFECDLLQTADGALVLRHDWAAGFQEGIDEDHLPTLEAFRATPIYGQFTPLAFTDLLQLMELFPDVYIITDTKDSEEGAVTAQFQEMVKEAEALGLEHLLDRFIIQLYSLEMYHTVEAVYDFSNYILTLYETDFYGETEVFETYATGCAELGIRHITMWSFLYQEEFLPIMERYGVSVYVHTVNEAGDAQALLERGVSGVYSDRIDPADLGDGLRDIQGGLEHEAFGENDQHTAYF